MSGRYYFALFLCCLSNYTQCDVVGSNTLLSLESHYIFPESPVIANEIRGFAWMKNGFDLATEDTECLFNALFPVSGSIDLKGGTLTLDQDLIFCDSINLSGWGTIIGQNHSLHLSPTISTLPANAKRFENCTLFCPANLDLLSSITFSGNCAIYGSNTVLSLGETGGLFIDTDSSLAMHGIEIGGVNHANVQAVDDTATLVLDTVRLLQDDSFTWEKGTLLFKNEVSFVGSTTFSYASQRTSTIASNAQVTINDGMHICLGRDFDTLREPLYFEDDTSVLRLDNCSFIATDSGITLTRGTIFLENRVQIDAMGTTTDTGIILGNGNVDADITIIPAPGAALEHNSGYWVYNNTLPDKIKSPSKTARMVRNLNSLIYMPQNMTLSDISVELSSLLVAPIQVASGKKLSYDNAAIKLPEIDLDVTSDQLNAYTYLLDGNDSLFLTKGVLPIYLLISGTNNQLRGNGGITGAITLSDAQTELHCGLNGFVDNAITLNSGTLLLDYDLVLRTNGVLYGPGILTVGSNYMHYSREPLDISTPLYCIGDNGGIGLNGKVTLMSTWTFQGTCRIDGNGANLILGDGGGIFVAENSELQIKNLRITGLSGENLSCVDDTGSVVFLGCDVVQSGDVAYKKGALKFFLKNTLSGAYTFSYDSSMTSTIKSDARVTVCDNADLYIGRNNGNEPLYFEDETSVLKFEDGKFSIKNSGMQLTRGTLISSRDVEVDVQSTSTQTGLVFGDGTAEGDMSLVLLASSTARFTGGHVTYNMERSDGIRSKSTTAQLIRSAASTFYLPHDLNLADITIDVSPYSTLIVDPGRTLTYTNARVVNDQDEFYLTTTWYNFFTMLLTGNGIVNLSNGTLPLYLLVQGTGNRLEGVGNVGGVITLANSSAELICDLSGALLKSVALNGGTISLNQNLKLGNGVLFSGGGTINLNTFDIATGNTDVTWSDNVWWNGTNAVLSLNSNVSLAATWTFNGRCVIKGKGHSLRLGSQGAIQVAPASQLLLQDIYLENIAGTNMACVDDTASIVLKDVNWGQHPSEGQSSDQDFSYAFTTGSLQFQNNVVIAGNALFSYETNQTSTIARDATLSIDTGMTFSYAPDGNNQLLKLENDNAKFMLNGASLYITSTGLQLTKGIFEVTDDSDITIDFFDTEDEFGVVTRTFGELIFGDGSSSENDCTSIVQLGVSLRLKQGICSYKNLLDSSWRMGNQLSTLELYPGTITRLYSSLPLGAGRVLISKYAHIDDQGGNDIIGAVAVLEELS